MAAEDKKKCGECGKWSHGEACAVCGAGRVLAHVPWRCDNTDPDKCRAAHCATHHGELFLCSVCGHGEGDLTFPCPGPPTKAPVCQAAAMDFATFLGEGKETVPPCHEPATEEIAGWKLCGGCAEALRWMRECFS